VSPALRFTASRGAFLFATSLALSLLVGFGVSAARRPTPTQASEAPSCQFAIERVGVGVECLAGPLPGSTARPGDRVTKGGSVVGRMSPAALAALEVPIDPNRASEAELTSLPGIGPHLARQIASYRMLHGPFAGAEDLLRVRGIGERTLARLRPRLAFSR
jgi:competence protein ComEA